MPRAPVTTVPLILPTWCKDDGVTVYPGDVFQVGGCFVLGAGNLCDFAHRSEYAGVYPLNTEC